MSKVVLITGGSTGIGRATGEFLQKKGFTVFGTSRNPNNYPEHPFILLPLDVTNSKSIENCIDQFTKHSETLDVLINNAGAGITGAIEEIPEEEIKRNFETNLFGPIAMIKAALPIMRTQGSGLIINITSIAGYMGLPYRGVYSASKGALELVTEALSMEVKAFGINVVNLAPGDVATNIADGRFTVTPKKESPYYESYNHSLSMMNEHVDAGSDPLEMAKGIFKIINANKPKIHYKEGAFMQKFSIALKRILPDRVYEKLLMNHYKL